MRHFRFSYLFALLVMVPAVFAANTLSAGGHAGTVRSQSADMIGVGNLQLGGALEYGQEWEYIQSVTPGTRGGSPRLWSGVGYIGVGILHNLDIGLNLPAYYDVPKFGDINAKGIGDLEFSVKLADFWCNGDNPFTVAYYLALQFPTGDKKDGFFPRHAYYGSEGNWSSGNVLFHPMLAGTIHFDRLKSAVPLRLNLNFGGVFNTPSNNDALNGSLGLEYIVDSMWTLFTELSAEERIITVHKEHPFADLINDPIFLTPGFKFTIPGANLTFTLAGDIGISESNAGYAQKSFTETGKTVLHQANPLYNAYIALNWLIPSAPRDRDGDGIVDKLDGCPDQPEDKDGFEDNDGCPDSDNDKDGIPDVQDKCPNQSGIAENNGCPDVDSDKDGFVDRLDKCPNEAGIAENGGCPDIDSDRDGVVDRLDKCPKDSGPAENHGCPDIDSDHDGVVDRLDRCPNVAGVPENQGCPAAVKEITRAGLVLKGVNFESGKAVLLGSSTQALDDMAESLRAWPEVTVEIQGHTDNTGNAAMNKELSRQRAETVKQYLIDKGIAAERLTAVGYGQDKPVADNKTTTGRALNRRVEVVRSN
jgi:outer membrane protein OmpA-like peptidoglycan-associated protein